MYWDSTVQVSGSNFTTTSASLVDITGLSYAAASSSTYEIEAFLRFQNSGTNAIQFTTAYSAAGATGTAMFFGNQSATASGGTSNMSALGVAAGPSFGLVATTDFMMFIRGVVITGANAGNITVQALRQTSGTLTVYIGSILKIKKLA